MIRSKYNLTCKAGHFHYAPNPQGWAGSMCMKPFGDLRTTSGDLMRKGAKCEEKMRLAARKDNQSQI